jgi:hypothetical protein
MTAHWGIEDPAAVQGTDLQKEAAFNLAFRYLKNRISAFISLPIRSLDRMGPWDEASGDRSDGRREFAKAKGRLTPACLTVLNDGGLPRPSLKLSRVPRIRRNFMQLLVVGGGAAV